DTDTFNDIDDQYALAYLIRSNDKLRLKAIYAAPFFNHKSASPADGMEKSYQEILNVLTLMDLPELKRIVYRGSTEYLQSEQQPVASDAAADL
ncbi:MAG: nucleoside hydrolase, partial [Clostridia bacterium]